MSNPLKSPESAPLVIGGAAVALGGLLSILWFSASIYIGFPVALVGIAVEFSGMWLHDRHHRRRGEPTHAMWGLNDRNRPSWLSRDRTN